MAFWIPWSIDAIVAAIFVFFFCVGLVDGSVSSFNIVLWVLILGVLAALVGGSLWLKSKGRRGVAIALLWVLAAPGVFAGILVLILLITQPRWN